MPYPACDDRARGNARSHGAAGHAGFSRALGAATGDTRSSYGDGRKRETATREPTGDTRASWRAGCRAHCRIPFRARLQPACHDAGTREDPRATRWRARGAGRRAAKAMSFLCGSPGRGRDVCPSETCGTATDARCKRRDRAWEGEANVNERTNRTTRAGVEARRCFCGWAAPVCSTRSAKTVTRRGRPLHRT